MEPLERKLRLAMIGCGKIAMLHAQNLIADGRADIAVCCDPRREAAEALRDSMAPGAAIETDEQRAFEQYQLDGVIICSPTTRHHDQASLAMERGLHVLCEKPLASDRAQILDLIERQKRSGCVLSIAHQRRYKAAYATARRELTKRAEFYGSLRQIHLFVCERWLQTIVGTWRDDPAVGAGYFGDAGIHQVDIIHFLTGLSVERVFAVSDRRSSRVEIVTAVLAELTGGVGLTAHFVGDANHWREDIHLHGAMGDLLLRGQSDVRINVLRAQNNHVEEISNLEPESSPDANFIDAILGLRPTLSPPQIALPIYDWTQAVLASAREGGWVQVGPQGSRR
jgi:predicted dehydrogenase